MSTITMPTVPPGTPWDPYRLTVWQYERLVAVGILAEDEPVELLNGLLVWKMAKGPAYTAACVETRDALLPLMPPGWHLQTEAAVRIPDYDEPEPDLSVVRGTARDYVRLNRPPEPAETALVIEVSQTTLTKDREEKQPACARGGIPVYWIINLVDRQVEVYTNPGLGGYQSRQDFAPGQDVPVQINGVEVGRVAVTNLLP
jgi:Uma2 family endonuclease